MLQFIIHDVLGTPAILVGLFSLIGLLLQKKAVSDVISGTLKTIMGFVILTSGAAIIATTLTTFSQLFEHSFHIQGVVPNTDAMAALAQKNYGTATAMIMVLGMLFSPCPYYAAEIYLPDRPPHAVYVGDAGCHPLCRRSVAILGSTGGGGNSRHHDGGLPGHSAALHAQNNRY